MPPLEHLEPRRLFAATGLDTHFGDGDGKVELGSRYNVLSVTGARGVVYALVANTAPKQQFIYKYDAKGHVDRSFGSFGAAALAFRVPAGQYANAARIAVDARTGAIYVGAAGSRKTATVARATLQIERLTAAGDADTSFGDGGVYAYTAQVPLSPSADVTFTLDKLVPLSHGQLLIAMDTTQSTDNGDPTGFRREGFTDIQIQRLRTSGRRDATFGRRGIAVVKTGTFTESSGDGGGRSATTASAFGDLQLLDDGRYRVVDTRETATRSYVDGGQASYNTITSTRYVDSIVVNRNGSLSVANENYTDTSDAVPNPAIFSHVLTRLTTRNATAVTEFRPVLATATGLGGVTVIGLNSEVAPTDSLAADARQIKVTRDTRSTPTALDIPGDALFQSVARADDGTTFVATSDGVTAFDAALDVDRTWGTMGTTAGTYSLYFPDDDGRLLFTYPDGFGRLDGDEI